MNPRETRVHLYTKYRHLTFGIPQEKRPAATFALWTAAKTWDREEAFVTYARRKIKEATP